MDLSEYQRKAARTIPKDEMSALLTNFCLGLSGESGELIDHFKKLLFHGHALDREYVEKELGDLLWYIAGISSVLSLDLSVIGDINIDKLAKRYPEGFSQKHSRDREDKVNSQDIMGQRKEAVYELAGSVNTTVAEGDYIVGAFVEIDQLFLEKEDGSGFRVSLGPLTKQEIKGVKARLGIED